MKKFLDIVVATLLYGIFLTIFCAIFAALFLGKDFYDWALNRNVDMHAYENEYTEILKVAFQNEPSSLEPTLIDAITRQRLVDTYETLVMPDNNMNLVLSLALSWGMIDDYTWEFKLRPNVKFHDGSSFDSEDVKASMERSISYPSSELANYLSGISEIQILDGLNIRFITKNPDPLFIQKVSMVFIIPSEYADKSIETPVGTGAYKFVSWDVGKNMKFERFPEYWGENSSKFGKVEAYFVPDKSERVQMLIDGKVDFLANVPYEAVELLKSQNFKIQNIPSLEVQFIVFNMQSELMKPENIRKGISLLIDQDDLIKKVGGFARNVSQFVSNGIFGFNSDIPKHKYDLDEAKALIGENFVGKTLQIHLLKGLDVLGEYLRQQLNGVGVYPVISYLDLQGLMDSMSNGKADIYFLAMKSDLGDASSFFDDIAFSQGGFNVGRYSNPAIDEIVKKSAAEMDVKKRLKMLKDAMEIVVKKDPLGVPLFEYENLYVFRSGISIEPRIDGFVHYDNLTVN